VEAAAWSDADMASIEKYTRTCTDALQKHVPEPIEAVAMLSRVGQTGTDALYFASPLAAMLEGRQASARAGGLPPRVAVALTATSIYLFDVKPKGFGIKVKGAPVIWARQSVRMTPVGVGNCDGVTVELLETGEVVQLENQRLVGLDGFNAAFYGRLAQTAA
jgi:hypothetical protein